MLTTILTIIIVVIVFIILFKIFKLLMRVLLIVLFLGLAWLTNPAIEEHRAEVINKYPDTQKEIKHCNVSDYYVFSLTTWWKDGESKVIGAGAFTQVIIFRSPN